MLTANVKAEGHGRALAGTKMFPPGARLVLRCPLRWDSARAIGVARGSRRIVEAWIKTDRLTNWRCTWVHRPAILRKLLARAVDTSEELRALAYALASHDLGTPPFLEALDQLVGQADRPLPIRLRMMGAWSEHEATRAAEWLGRNDGDINVRSLRERGRQVVAIAQTLESAAAAALVEQVQTDLERTDDATLPPSLLVLDDWLREHGPTLEPDQLVRLLRRLSQT